MTLKTQAGVLVLVAILAFAVGRFTVTKTVTKDVETKTAEKEQENKDVHTVTKTVVVKEPTGRVVTTTVTDTKADTKETDLKNSTVQEHVEVKTSSKMNVSLLGSYDLSSPAKVPAVGLSVTKEVIGPITVGAYGMNNGTIGVSIGVNF